MTRKDLRQRVEILLQDNENKRWSDSEINGYLDDAQTEFCRLSKVPKVSVIQNLVDVTKSFTSASLSISSKTVTVTLGGSATHTLVENDSVLITGSSNNDINGAQVITSATSGTNTFSFVLDNPSSGTETGITVLETGPFVDTPSSILELQSVYLDDRELAIYTESQLNNVSNRNNSSGRYLQTVLGATPHPFNNMSLYRSSKWKKVEGEIEGIIISERSADNFRLFPLPSKEEHVYFDKDATAKVSLRLVVRGVRDPDNLSTDTSIPSIPEQYQEGLVFGALERAYLKESQLRNVEKSGLYKSKFMNYVSDAIRNENLNSTSITMGRNQAQLRVYR